MPLPRPLRLWLALGLSAVALVQLAAAPQRTPGRRPGTGTIRGSVDFKVAPAERDRRVNPADMAMPGQHDAADRRRSVVYLDPAPRAAFDAREEPHVRLDQRDEQFVPHVLAIVAGTVVDFPNNDRTYHNVFSLSKTRSFDLGRYSAGRSKAIRFDQPGIVRVFCDIHSHMSAFILVFAHRYFAVTDEDGRYHIDNVPPGQYTVVAWNEAMPSETGIAQVPEGGRGRALVPLRAAMRILSSLTNRIFLGSAALAVLTIAVAVYRINVAVTVQAENELRRGLEEAGTQLEENRDTLFGHFSREARLISDLSNLKAAMDTGHQPTVEPIALNYQRQIGADLLVVTDPTGRMLAQAGRLRDAGRGGRTRRRSPARRKGHEVVSLWPHPGGVIQVVSVPSYASVQRAGRHGERRVQPRRAGGAAVQGPDQQRDCLCGRRRGPGVDAAAREASGHARRPGRREGVHRVTIGDTEYVAVSRTLVLNLTGEGATGATPAPCRPRSSCARAPIDCASSRWSIATCSARRSWPFSPRRWSATASPAPLRVRLAASPRRCARWPRPAI